MKTKNILLVEDDAVIASGVFDKVTANGMPPESFWQFVSGVSSKAANK